jgi:hypothetical protein
VKRNLNANQLGFPNGETVYINQSLTPYRRNIRGQARKVKSEKKTMHTYGWIIQEQLTSGKKGRQDCIYMLKHLKV